MKQFSEMAEQSEMEINRYNNSQIHNFYQPVPETNVVIHYILEVTIWLLVSNYATKEILDTFESLVNNEI